jgi:hypothetical protein
MFKSLRWTGIVLCVILIGASLSPASSCTLCNVTYDTADCVYQYFSQEGTYGDDCYANCAFFDAQNWGFIACFCYGSHCEWV